MPGALPRPPSPSPGRSAPTILPPRPPLYAPPSPYLQLYHPPQSEMWSAPPPAAKPLAAAPPLPPSAPRNAHPPSARKHKVSSALNLSGSLTQAPSPQSSQESPAAHLFPAAAPAARLFPAATVVDLASPGPPRFPVGARVLVTGEHATDKGAYVGFQGEVVSCEEREFNRKYGVGVKIDGEKGCWGGGARKKRRFGDDI